MKKVITVCLILLGLIVIGFVGNYTAHENVTFVHGDDGKYVLYQDNEYYPAPFFTATKYHNTANEGDVELGWYYSFPFSTRFYSYTSENPVYLYAIQSVTGVYFEQGYDYKSEAYRIEDTSRTIVLSEAVTGGGCEARLRNGRAWDDRVEAVFRKPSEFEAVHSVVSRKQCVVCSIIENRSLSDFRILFGFVGRNGGY